MVTDPISDFIIRLKNAGLAHKESVTLPYSKIKEAIEKLESECSIIEASYQNGVNNFKYVDDDLEKQLESEDDNFIHQSIYENVRDNCQSSMFKIAKEVKKEDSEDDSEDEREEESEDDRSDEDEKLRELYQQYSPVTQRRIQRMLRQSHFIF